MPVPVDDLRTCRIDTQSELFAYDPFQSWRGDCVDPHRAAHLPYGHVVLNGFKAFDIPPELRVPVSTLESKCDRFRVDAVGSSDLGRFSVLSRQPCNLPCQPLRT